MIMSIYFKNFAISQSVNFSYIHYGIPKLENGIIISSGRRKLFFI